jgi:hypothetical protein
MLYERIFFMYLEKCMMLKKYMIVSFVEIFLLICRILFGVWIAVHYVLKN